jgi:hypothetical protein
LLHFLRERGRASTHFFYRLDNLGVPGTPAKVPSERFFNLTSLRLSVFLQQRFRDQQNSGRAIPALSRTEICK